MIEHTQREGDKVRFDRDTRTGQNIVPRGSEAQAGQAILDAGHAPRLRAKSRWPRR